MGFIKKTAKIALIVSIVTLIVGFVLFVFNIDLGMLIMNHIGYLPGTSFLLFVISMGAIFNSLPVIIIGFSIPFILLIGACLLGRAKKLSRIMVYPILLADLLISCVALFDGMFIHALIPLIFIALALLSDLLPA